MPWIEYNRKQQLPYNSLFLATFFSWMLYTLWGISTDTACILMGPKRTTSLKWTCPHSPLQRWKKKSSFCSLWISVLMLDMTNQCSSVFFLYFYFPYGKYNHKSKVICPFLSKFCIRHVKVTSKYMIDCVHIGLDAYTNRVKDKFKSSCPVLVTNV